MRGKILDYNLQEGDGVISGDDGQRYNFKNTEWKSSEIHPSKDIQIDFMIEDNNALAIYATEGLNSTSTVLVQTSQTSTSAIVSLVFGLLGFISSWWLFAMPSIVAIITGHMARSAISRSDGKLSGDGLALAGLILGYMIITVYIFVIIFAVGAIGVAASMQY